MVHPETMKVINYPNTAGKKFALNMFGWDKLTKVEEATKASEIIKVAKMFDKS